MLRVTMVGFGRAVACAIGMMCSAGASLGAGLPWIVEPYYAQGNSGYGEAIAMTGDTLFVGARRYFDGANETGAVFVRRWVGLDFAVLNPLVATDLSDGDRFGAAIAADGATVIVGAPQDDGPAGPNQGSAYIFVFDGADWVQQAKLTADDATVVDLFGSAVAIDGDTAIVGAFNKTGNAGAAQGAAYIFTRSGTVWTQQAKLLGNNMQANDWFGWSVAVSGDTVLIGAPFADTLAGPDRGAAFVYTRTGSAWTFQKRLYDPLGAFSDEYAYAVALEGDRALIGAPRASAAFGVSTGAAIVYDRTGAVWNDGNGLEPYGANLNARVGHSVALDGDLVVLGAPQDYNAIQAGVGAGYVFACEAGVVWSQIGKTWHFGNADDVIGRSVAISDGLMALGAPGYDFPQFANGAVLVYQRVGPTWLTPGGWRIAGLASQPNDNFGHAVGVSDTSAIVGIPYFDPNAANPNAGGAEVYERTGYMWAWRQRLLPSDGAQADNFGWSVAIDGTTAIIGAPLDDDAGNASGSAYVFVRSGGVWTQQAKLTAPDAAPSDQFGWSVGIDGESVIVGARGDDNANGFNAGAAYVFTRLNGVWSFQAKLIALNPVGNSEFGTAVDIDSNLAIIGAPYDGQVAASAGAAYIFFRNSSSVWGQVIKLTAADGGVGDFYGSSVAISPEQAIVGAPYHDHAFEDDGAAYTYGRFGTFWAPVAELTVPNSAPFDNFGASVDIEFGAAAVGAPFHNAGEGGVWVFDHGSAPWLATKFQPADGVQRVALGSAIGMSSGTVIAGAPGEIGSAGGAYLFDGTFGISRNESAHNLNSATTAPTLAGALATALHGDLISALYAGFGANQPQDFAGRAINLMSTAEITQIFAGSLTLADGATLTAQPTRHSMLFGAVTTPDNATMSLNGESLRFGPLATFDAGDGTTHNTVGGLDVAIADAANFSGDGATFRFLGGVASKIEAMSADRGPDCAVQPFELGAVHLGSGKQLTIVDRRTNELGGAGRDALYIGALSIESGSTLVTNGHTVYYHTLDNQGAVDTPANLVLRCACAPDLSGDSTVDGADLGLLLGAWGTPEGDLNGDGTTDGADLGLLLGAWGSCP